MRASRLPVISAGSLLWKKKTLRGWSESRYTARMNDISVMIGRKEPADGSLANDVYYATVYDMKSDLALHSSRWVIAICSLRLVLHLQNIWKINLQYVLKMRLCSQKTLISELYVRMELKEMHHYIHVWNISCVPSFQCWENIVYKHLCCKKEPWK